MLFNIKSVYYLAILAAVSTAPIADPNPKSRLGSAAKGIAEGISTAADAVTVVNAIEGALHKRDPKSRLGSAAKGIAEGISTVADAITVGEAINQAVHKRDIAQDSFVTPSEKEKRGRLAKSLGRLTSNAETNSIHLSVLLITLLFL
ncbi:hypothetical protein HK103_000837 [Boothiomyces macroporosus]|uniref:Uncharacterized protein n=1 Tax=Boothiomyces macroporosus TaxID=261099 RepID=A0AAD5UBC3_9FUNG|nr:hypothetical protein HK103_000837 [Boothiomyces macroporosus]